MWSLAPVTKAVNKLCIGSLIIMWYLEISEIPSYLLLEAGIFLVAALSSRLPRLNIFWPQFADRMSSGSKRVL
jgi:hypothetical protein